jgi:ribosome-associated protein
MAKTSAKRSPGSSVTRLPKVVHRALRAAFDKKAERVTVLDLREADAFTDFFIICSGQGPRQVKAIAEAVEAALRRARVRPLNVEGVDHAEWVLLDYFDFLVHVFTPDTREFYALERLWGSAERIDVSEADLPAM